MAYFSKTFTESEKSEICRSYKLAKDPGDQISILADLNACDKASIRNVLIEANLLKGVASPPLRRRLIKSRRKLHHSLLLQKVLGRCGPRLRFQNLSI